MRARRHARAGPMALVAPHPARKRFMVTIRFRWPSGDPHSPEAPHPGACLERDMAMSPRYVMLVMGGSRSRRSSLVWRSLVFLLANVVSLAVLLTTPSACIGDLM